VFFELGGALPALVGVVLEGLDLSRKRKKKRERLKKQEIERNKGRVYCTIRVFCDGECRNANFKRGGQICREAFYKTSEGEVPVKIGV
jgi:radical SAM protein with 4Fe4S-binding SPASM domain